MSEKQSTKSNQKIIGVVAYLFWFISGIILLLIEKENKFIRFHAMQSTILFGGIFVLRWILEYLPFLGLVESLLSILTLILWVVLMIKAYQGELYKLPYVGKIAEEQLAKMK